MDTANLKRIAFMYCTVHHPAPSCGESRDASYKSQMHNNTVKCLPPVLLVDSWYQRLA